MENGTSKPSISMNGSRMEKHCRICGDRAFAFNFNGLSCESCKAFFRRNVIHNLRFECRFNGNCTINLKTRKKCKACRMMKCIQIGMQPELVARNPSRNPSTTEESSKSTDDIEEAVPILNGDVYRLQVYDFERMNQVNDAMKLFYDERKLSIVSQVRNYIHMFEVVESYWKIISFFGQCFHDFASINDSDRRIAVNHAHLYIYPIIFSFAYRKSVNGAPMMIDPKCNTGILIRNDNLSPNPKINQTIIEWSKLFHDMMDDDIVIRNLLISYQLFNQPVEKVKEKYNLMRYNKHVYDYLLQKYLHYKYKDETKANNQYQELIRVAREFPTADEKFLQQYAQSVNPDELNACSSVSEDVYHLRTIKNRTDFSIERLLDL